MSMEDKVLLINNLKDACADVLTVNERNSVVTIVNDILSKFDVTHSDETETRDDCLSAFLTAKEIEGRSKATLDRYQYLIGRLMSFLKIQTQDVTIFHIRKFLSSEKDRGISEVTLEGMREAFCAYFNWLQKEGLIKVNPCGNLGAIKYKKVVKQAYKDTDIERLKFACRTKRDLALVCFLRSTGCRVSEVVNLNRDDVNLTKGECKVLGKGNKERVVYIDSITAMILDDYLQSRTDDFEALFPGNAYRNRTTRLSAQGIRKLLKTIAANAKVTTNVHPHKFRRTLATSLIRHGMPIQEVAAILGHEKLDTTMKYVVMDNTDIHYSYNKFFS